MVHVIMMLTELVSSHSVLGGGDRGGLSLPAAIVVQETEACGHATHVPNFLLTSCLRQVSPQRRPGDKKKQKHFSWSKISLSSRNLLVGHRT